REDVVPRAATDQKVHNGTMRGIVAAIPATCPTDDFHVVVVTVSDDITAGISQPPHYIDVTAGRGPVHGVGVVSLLAGVHVQAASQQQVHHRQVPVLCCEMQQRPVVRLGARVQLVRMLVQQRGEGANVALTCSVEQFAFYGERIYV